ncbi:MAG: hypothetical protein C5B51_27375 [Terriglobia bacterium]|nr:MAG: hypothetical protein C5B51_27375 [Terriglobia bacterium]
MRVLIANWHRNIVGGVETYLQAVIPEIQRRGHEIALVHGYQTTTERETVHPNGVFLPCWNLEELGLSNLLRSVENWRPELVFTHVLESVELETALVERYPTALFVHGHYGMCATGRKCCRVPKIQPCNRTFGRMCLVLHYPRRCGGLGPVTAVKNYRSQSKRNALLPRFSAVLAASEYIAKELRNHGVQSERIHVTPLPPSAIEPGTHVLPPRTPEGRILMMGRLTDVKGCDYLMRAIAIAARRLDRPLHLTIAGAGPEEHRLKLLGTRLGIPVEYLGWVANERRRKVIQSCDLLAVPSLWPEPFGLVGIEAGCLGVPAVGYAVGGIPEWLHGGITGELASGDPPTVEGLAQAIVRAFGDHEHYRDLCLGAWRMAQRRTISPHVDLLEAIFRGVAAPHDRVKAL